MFSTEIQSDTDNDCIIFIVQVEFELNFQFPKTGTKVVHEYIFFRYKQVMLGKR